MPKYLLDTNTCIFLLRGKYRVNDRINAVGWDNCYISEITVAELKYGAEFSDDVEKHAALVRKFVETIQVIPFARAIDVYAREKARLRRSGMLIDEFDLLIGSTAVACDCVMVTENVKHLSRLSSINIENWINR